MKPAHLLRLIAPLRRRVLLMVGRAVLTLVDDARRMQTVQVQALAGETLADVERVQQYGLTSHPHPGAECVVVSVGGMRQHPLVVAVDDRRHRPTGLAQGEVALYTDEDSDDAPHRVILRRGRRIELRAGSTSIVMTPSGITMRAPAIDMIQGSG